MSRKEEEHLSVAEIRSRMRNNEDYNLAARLQDEENRVERRIVGTDVKTSKVVQHHEDLAARQARLVNSQRIAETDEEYARRILAEEEAELERLRRARQNQLQSDEELARRLQQEPSPEPAARLPPASNDGPPLRTFLRPRTESEQNELNRMADHTALRDLPDDFSPTSTRSHTSAPSVAPPSYSQGMPEHRPLAFLAPSISTTPSNSISQPTTMLPTYELENERRFVEERIRVPGLPLPGLANTAAPPQNIRPMAPSVLSPTESTAVGYPTTVALPPIVNKGASSVPPLRPQQSEDWPAPPEFVRPTSSLPRIVQSAHPLPVLSPPAVAPTLSHDVPSAIPQVTNLHPTNPFLADLCPATSSAPIPHRGEAAIIARSPPIMPMPAPQEQIPLAQPPLQQTVPHHPPAQPTQMPQPPPVQPYFSEFGLPPPSALALGSTPRSGLSRSPARPPPFFPPSSSHFQ